MPKIEMKPTAADTLNGIPVNQKRQNSSEASNGYLGHDDECVDPGVSRAIKDRGDQYERKRNADLESVNRLPQFAILSRPFEVHALGQFHSTGNALLCLTDGAFEVSSAHGESQRHVT